MSSIILPPKIFLPYVYFGVILFSFGYLTLLSLFTRLVAWLHSILSQPNEPEHMEIPAPEPQVVLDIVSHHEEVELDVDVEVEV